MDFEKAQSKKFGNDSVSTHSQYWVHTRAQPEFTGSYISSALGLVIKAHARCD